MLVVVTRYLGWLRPFENFSRRLLFPSAESFYNFSAKAGEQYQFFKDPGHFLASYDTCVNQLATEQAHTARQDLLLKENEELRQLLKFKVRQTAELVSAEVVGVTVEGAEQVIVINAGSSGGIKPNQPVTSGDGILVGKVFKVETDSATVRLINDNQSKVAAMVVNGTRSLGVIEGGYGISLRMDFIPRNEAIAVGDKIVTSGLEPGMPKGLFVGTVASIENEAFKPFQQTVLTPALNLSKLSTVSVLLTL